MDATSTDAGVSLQKIPSFLVFTLEQKNRLNRMYPFLSKDQISKRVKKLWDSMTNLQKGHYQKTVIVNKKKAITKSRLKTPKMFQAMTLFSRYQKSNEITKSEYLQNKNTPKDVKSSKNDKNQTKNVIRDDVFNLPKESPLTKKFTKIQKTLKSITEDCQLEELWDSPGLSSQKTYSGKGGYMLMSTIPTQIIHDTPVQKNGILKSGNPQARKKRNSRVSFTNKDSYISVTQSSSDTVSLSSSNESQVVDSAVTKLLKKDDLTFESLFPDFDEIDKHEMNTDDDWSDNSLTDTQSKSVSSNASTMMHKKGLNKQYKAKSRKRVSEMTTKGTPRRKSPRLKSKVCNMKDDDSQVVPASPLLDSPFGNSPSNTQDTPDLGEIDEFGTPIILDTKTFNRLNVSETECDPTQIKQLNPSKHVGLDEVSSDFNDIISGPNKNDLKSNSEKTPERNDKIKSSQNTKRTPRKQSNKSHKNLNKKSNLATPVKVPNMNMQKCAKKESKSRANTKQLDTRPLNNSDPKENNKQVSPKKTVLRKEVFYTLNNIQLLQQQLHDITNVGTPHKDEVKESTEVKRANCFRSLLQTYKDKPNEELINPSTPETSKVGLRKTRRCRKETNRLESIKQKLRKETLKETLKETRKESRKETPKESQKETRKETTKESQKETRKESRKETPKETQKTINQNLPVTRITIDDSENTEVKSDESQIILEKIIKEMRSSTSPVSRAKDSMPFSPAISLSSQENENNQLDETNDDWIDGISTTSPHPLNFSPINASQSPTGILCDMFMESTPRNTTQPLACRMVYSAKRQGVRNFTDMYVDNDDIF